MSKHNGFLLACVTAIFCLATSGCSLFEPEGLRTLRETNTAAGNLADVLETVRDAQSAEASLQDVDDRFGALVDVLKRLNANLGRYKNERVNAAALGQVTRDMESNLTRVNREIDRLNHLSGLPVAFWKVAKARSFDLIETSVGLSGVTLPGDLFAYLHSVRALYDQYGVEQVVMVDLKGLSPFHAQAARDKLQKLAPEATLCHFEQGQLATVVLAPVKDYGAFVAKLDLGTITYRDQSRGAVEIDVDGRKLARESLRGRAGTFPPQTDEAQQEFQKKMEEQRKKLAEEAEARERERKGPDPSDPDYLGKMADRATSGNVFYKDSAIDALLKADPAAASPEAKKKVARAFKALAEDDSPFDHPKAVKGLVKWAGTYSVPVLLKMLDGSRFGDEEHVLRALAELKDPRAVPVLVKKLNDSRHFHDEDLIINTLVEMKDPRAAPALAARISDFRIGKQACDGLREMGSIAEDAIIEVAKVDDSKQCIAVLGLLGDVGTAKCLGLLSQAESSRDRNVRLAAYAAKGKVNKRRFAAKAKPKAVEGDGQQPSP